MIAVVAIYTLDRGNQAKTLEMAGDGSDSVEMLRVKVVERYPHDVESFTQGLVWHNGTLYESSGMRGKSSLRQVELLSGQLQRKVALAPTLFGEGLARVGDRLVQLTWTSGKGLVYRRDDLQQIGEFSYPGQGWGLCYDGTHLIMSDGTAYLRFLDPTSFKQRGRIQVTIRGRPQTQINALECVGDKVYANVWEYDEILRIDRETGRVEAIIDASGLLTPAQRGKVDVLNGIAYMPERKRFLLTGKYWPYLFEVDLVPR